MRYPYILHDTVELEPLIIVEMGCAIRIKMSRQKRTISCVYTCCPRVVKMMQLSHKTRLKARLQGFGVGLRGGP